jgi:hypothetical protein
MIPEPAFRERDSVQRDFALAMMEPHHTRLCASAAIAAALALASTPLSAQVAEAPPPVAPDPVLTLPTAPPPQPAQPTIVLPAELPEAAPPAEAAAPDPAPRDTARTERPAPRARAATAAPAPVAALDPEPVAAEEGLAPIAPEPAVETATPVAANEPAAAPAAPETDNTPFLIAVLAGLAAIALAIWGFIAIGRRKSADRKAALLIERPVVKPREPEAQPVAAEAGPTPSVSPIHPVAPAPSMAHTGASVPLPSKVPANFEERDALIKRMVAAKPDRANPFTSPIQRRKRAKLILQSLDRDFGKAESWIDLSQYPANWPELARKQAAA